MEALLYTRQAEPLSSAASYQESLLKIVPSPREIATRAGVSGDQWLGMRDKYPLAHPLPEGEGKGEGYDQEALWIACWIDCTRCSCGKAGSSQDHHRPGGCRG